MSKFSTGLPREIHKSAFTVPGTTSDSKETVERLLEQDREAYSCFYGPVPFHNHLSHHLLAAYDLGASPSLLQAIYDKDAPGLRPIFAAERKGEIIEAQDVKVNSGNWREYLGQEIYYPNLLEFFSEEVKRLGGAGAYEYWVFSKDANDQGAYMTERFIGGALHPLIQMGYAIEFSSDAMVAQALAQTAVHRPYYPNLFSWNVLNDETTATKSSHPLLGILAAAYESNILTPVLPYDPDALLTQRTQDALTTERQAEIRRLIACWVPSVLSVRTPEVLTNEEPDLDELELKDKARELAFFATLLFAGTGRRGLDPRLDFFLMHVLTSSLFVVPLAAILTAPASRARLLSSYLGATLAILLVRGRPRIDPELLMQYTATPVPPSQRSQPETLKVADPWTTMLPHALAARDAHTVKAFRVLYAAAQRYGNIDRDYLRSHGGHRGEKVDGRVFVRAAGVLLDVMGWVGPGGDGKEGTWDRSALGWDGAWAEEMRMKGLL